MNIIWTRCSRILISPEFWGPSLVYLDTLGFRPILISRDAGACGPQFGRPQFGGAHNQCHKQIRSQQQSDQKLDCWKHLGSRLVSRHVHVLYLRASWLHWNSWGWVHSPSARGRRSCHYCCRSHLFAWYPMGNCCRYYHDSFHSCGGRNWSGCRIGTPHCRDSCHNDRSSIQSHSYSACFCNSPPALGMCMYTTLVQTAINCKTTVAKF